MRFYLAPMEGLTGCVFRNCLNKYFPGTVKFFSPFISPDPQGKMKSGSLRDILPENNENINLVPQVLCNQAENFLAASRVFADMGYKEINLNAGCPSATVVPKHKGAGMLLDLNSLDNFLADVFSRCELKISVKTRLGVESSSEFPEILEIYNKYPVSELTVHARDRAGMYKSPVDLPAFRYALQNSKAPVVYNGNIFSGMEYERLLSEAPCDCIMLGRGVCANPALPRQLSGGRKLSSEELRAFLDELSSGLVSSGLGEHFALARLKELWYYMQDMFPGGEKAVKQIKRAKYLSDYNAALDVLFSGGYFSADCKFRG